MPNGLEICGAPLGGTARPAEARIALMPNPRVAGSVEDPRRKVPSIWSQEKAKRVADRQLIPSGSRQGSASEVERTGKGALRGEASVETNRGK